MTYKKEYRNEYYKKNREKILTYAKSWREGRPKQSQKEKEVEEINKSEEQVNPLD